MPTKKKNENEIATLESMGQIEYVDANGNAQTVDLADVQSMGDEEWYQDTRNMFPDTVQCCVINPLRSGAKFDDKGRPNILGENHVILTARSTDANSRYGRYFVVMGIHPTHGKISYAIGGTVVAPLIEEITGVSLETGTQKQKPKPCAVRIIHVDGGQFENGYFDLVGAATELVEAE